MGVVQRTSTFGRMLGKLYHRAIVFTFLLVLPTIAAAANPKYASIVIDHNSGKVLYGRNADAPRYPASLTKIMTLYLVFKELKAGKINLDHKLVVTDYASSQAPSKLGLKPGDTIRVRDAVSALVTKSANDVAVVIAENFAGSEDRFAEVMTVTARKIGMRNTVFRNASGLPNSDQVTTARDMAILSRRMMDDFPKLSRFFRMRYYTYHKKRYRNHNSLLFNYRGTTGIKTGYTRASGFNLAASVERGKKHLIAVVMGGKSARKRNAHMRYLLNNAWGKASSVKRRVKPAKPKPQVFVQNLSNPPAPAQFAAKARPVAVAQKVAYNNNALRPSVSAAPVLAQSQDIAGPYHVQIGAFETQNEADARLAAVHSAAGDLLKGHLPITMPVPVGDRHLVRARFASFSQQQARAVCAQLKLRAIDCLAVKAQ